MKHVVFTAVLLTFGLAPSIPAAPWAIEWSHLTASDNTEPNAVLLGNPSKKFITVGTTYGRVTDPAGEAPDVFRSVLDAKGKLVSVEQFGGAGGQYLRGAVRSCWGNETLVLRDFTKQTCDLINRSPNGKERWRLPMPPEQSPTTGVVRDFWGNHWIATRPNNSSMPYAMSKISGSGKLLWTRDASGPEKLGMPLILRRDPNGDLITGIWSQNVGVACYDPEMKLKWHTVLESRMGVPRDITFDSSGRLFVTTVFYDLSDWHTKLWCLSADGKVLGSARIKAQYFSGWRVATDKQGHVYVAGMEYGEAGYPLIVEFDATLKESGRFYVDRESEVFINSLEVSPDGKTLTMAGSAYRRWLGKPTSGSADAFVVRCHRDDTNPAEGTMAQKPIYKKPGLARPDQFPW